MLHPGRDLSIVTYGFFASSAWVLLTLHASRPDAIWPLRILHRHRFLWVLIPLVNLVPALLWPISVLLIGSYYLITAVARTIRNKRTTTTGDVEMDPVDRKQTTTPGDDARREFQDLITIAAEEDQNIVEERDLGERLGGPWLRSRSPSPERTPIHPTVREFV